MISVSSADVQSHSPAFRRSRASEVTPPAPPTSNKSPRPEPVTVVASIHSESFELEFGEKHVRISLLGLQTLRSIDAVYGALLESRHYREGLNWVWDLREAELFGLSDWDWALLTSRLARAPLAKRRARMVWVLPRLFDDTLESKVRRLMGKLKMVDWRFASDLDGAVSWASASE